MIKFGIDPGKTTGVAILFNGKIESLITTDFWGAYQLAISYSKDIEIHIEDTNDLPVFRHAKNQAIKGAMGRSVGSVCREASLLAEGFRRLGYAVICHGNKSSSKLDDETFRRITGWKGRTNQHVRDAACLVI